MLQNKPSMLDKSLPTFYPKWEIDKTFEFCYGHRVWVQQLQAEYADDLKCACRHLHGHEGKVHVFLTAENLNKQSMVTDFRHLEWLKKWINQYIDHRFIIDRFDPLFERLVGVNVKLRNVYVTNKETGRSYFVGSEVDPEHYEELPGSMQELLQGFFIVDFVPTSEKLSEWLATMVQFYMNPLGVRVSRVDWWETPKSRSSYIA